MLVNLAIALPFDWLDGCYPDVVRFPTNRAARTALRDDQPLCAVFDRLVKHYANIADIE